jgi:uncharacterized DUF497 family protein
MIDLNKIIGFNWDAGNESKSVGKHSVDKYEAEQVFFNKPLLIVEDQKHSDDEVRLHALGKTNQQRLLHITFTLRSHKTLIRIISARDMHRKERKIYEQK